MGYTILPQHVQDSPEWHDARRQSVGASEVAAILGLSPWQTPLDVYRAKMGVPNEIPEDLAYFGHALEPVIAGWLESKHDMELSDGYAARSDEWPWLTASPDRMAYDWALDHGGARPDDSPYVPVELKTSSAYSKESWASGVPLYYQTQVQAQLAVLDAPYGWLAVLHGGNSPELFRVERDQAFIEDHLIPKTKAFWEDHVLAQVPPEPVTTAEAVSLWPGDEDLVVDGTEDLYDLWSEIGRQQALAVEANDFIDGAKLALQKAMQDATTLRYQGRDLFTWKPRRGSRTLDKTALEKAHPDIVREFTREGNPSRVFIRKTVKEVEQ